MDSVEYTNVTANRLKAVVVYVVAMALLVVFFEDIMMFFAATRSGPDALMNSPYVMIGIPLALSLSLIVVLIGGTIIYSDTLR